MAIRNGVDVVESTVRTVREADGSYSVLSVVTTLEYTGASSVFAEFLASELREGRTFPSAGRTYDDFLVKN